MAFIQRPVKFLVGICQDQVMLAVVNSKVNLQFQGNFVTENL